VALAVCATVAVGVAIAVLVFDVGGGSGRDDPPVAEVTPPTTQESPSPSTEPPTEGVAVARDLTGACSVTASSTLPGEAGNSYGP
jgi:hypothetical protein